MIVVSQCFVMGLRYVLRPRRSVHRSNIAEDMMMIILAHSRPQIFPYNPSQHMKATSLHSPSNPPYLHPITFPLSPFHFISFSFSFTSCPPFPLQPCHYVYSLRPTRSPPPSKPFPIPWVATCSIYMVMFSPRRWVLQGREYQASLLYTYPYPNPAQTRPGETRGGKVGN